MCKTNNLLLVSQSSRLETLHNILKLVRIKESLSKMVTDSSRFIPLELKIGRNWSAVIPEEIR